MPQTDLISCFTERIDHLSLPPRRLQPVQILDWYDGIVLAVTRTSWCDGIFLASLLAWAQAERKRTFALIPLSEEQGETIKSKTDWEDLKEYLRSIVAEISGDVLLIGIDGTKDEVAGEQRVAVRDIRSELVGDIEEALHPLRRRWIDEISANYP
jgi:hypothetical protein